MRRTIASGRGGSNNPAMPTWSRRASFIGGSKGLRTCFASRLSTTVRYRGPPPRFERKGEYAGSSPACVWYLGRFDSCDQAEASRGLCQGWKQMGSLPLDRFDSCHAQAPANQTARNSTGRVLGSYPRSCGFDSLRADHSLTSTSASHKQCVGRCSHPGRLRSVR